MDGIINVYKEAGFTSHDVVAKLRGILKQKKIGHTGTLDPAAIGVLPVCVGKATKVCELLTEKDKTYQAVCRLGMVTDTQDATGKVLEEHSIAEITEQNLREVVASFQGEIEQIPPMYSAIKVDGKKLYELAREGKTIERKPRKVNIMKIHIVQIDLEEQTFVMEITCSKGTYIRTLCHDIGQKLGVGAIMQSLVRTRVAGFHIKDALTLAQIEDLVQENKLQEKMYAIEAIFSDYPKRKVLKEYSKNLANGNILKKDQLEDLPISLLAEMWINQSEWSVAHKDEYMIYDENGNFKAIYRKRGDTFSVVKMF